MAHSTPTSRSRRSALGGLRFAGALLLLALPAAAQAHSDQVAYRDSTGRARTWRGAVQENSLERTVISAGGRTRNIDSERVDLVIFGDVPAAYQEGQAYLDLGDFENAAARFQVVAGDSSARDVVRASARMRAGEARMRAGAKDHAAYSQAADQFERFLTDFPESRGVPLARFQEGRAKRMAGDPTAAAEIYRGLYGEGMADPPTRGYSPLLSARAGVAAAEALLESGDVAGAATLFGEVASALTSRLAGLADNDPSRFQFGQTLAEARLGEGFCLLAQGSGSQARTFFQGQLSSAGKTGSQRNGAHLGLAESLLADSRYREAEIEFAQVSAIEPVNRDRIARALLGLATCAEHLADAEAPQQRKLWLETLTDQYGDTPSALRAQELLKTL